MNRTRMSIAYSPRSEALEDVVRSATAKLLLRNANLIPEIIRRIRNATSEHGDSPFSQSIQNFTLPCNITLPDIDLPENLPEIVPDKIDIDWSIVYTMLRSCINVIPYNQSSELRGIYAEEAETRKVVAAVQFDDALFGKFYLIC